MTVVKFIEKKTQCTASKNCNYVYFQWSCTQLKLFRLFLLLQHFQYILQLIYRLIFFLHLHISQSKYSTTSHHLSHLHLQLLEFQIDPLSNTPLSINSLHPHLHLSSFQRFLLLQTLAPNLHLKLHALCHSMCHVSLVLDIR